MKSRVRSSIHTFDVGRFTSLWRDPNWPRSRGQPRVDLEPQSSEIARNGFTILPDLIDHSTCETVIKEYDHYEEQCVAAGVQLHDPKGRNYRLTNFHLVCKNALDIACRSEIHVILDAYFGRQSMVYTSLFYKHGSQQSTHIDTPFFVSNPIGWYAGVWVALEDIHPDAGPVEYYPGAHRKFDTIDKLRDIQKGTQGIVDFFSGVKSIAEKVTKPAHAILKKGDVLIWHHGLPHGGQLAVDPKLTRYSLVFHMGAEGVNLKTNGLFSDTQGPELPRYGRFLYRGRRVARVGLPRIMV